MATEKNKRSTLKPKKEESEITKKLRARLKEDYEHFMNEADDEPLDDDLGLDAGGEDEGGEMGGGEDFGGEGGEDFGGGGGEELGGEGDFEGEEGLEGEDEYVDPTADLTPTEDETFEEYTDELLEPELDLLQHEEEEGEEALDGPVTAGELEDIIDSPDTYHELGSTLASVAQEEDGDLAGEEGGDEDFSFGDEEEYEEGFEDGEDFGEDEAGLEFDDEGDDEFDDIEESVMLEAEVEQEINEALNKQSKTKKVVKKQPEKVVTKKKLKETEDPYDGVDVPDEFKKTDSDLQKSFGKVSGENKSRKIETKPKFAGVTDNKTAKKVETKPTFKKVTSTSGGGAGDGKKVAISEEVKKSKMLVEASKQIALLQKQVNKFKLEAYKITKANGILTAVGDKLDKETRLKISESFDKCSNPQKIDNLYKKLVKVIREQAHESLNETVQRTKSSVKTINSLKESENFETNKPEQINEKDSRIRFLMGLEGYNDSYFQ